jgi:putative membrane protein
MGYSLLNYLSLITIGISGLSILAGLFFIKKGKREIHRFFMINASIFAAVITLRYAFKNMFEKHRKIAPISAFVWLYVAITGWLIYFFMQWLNKNA